MRIIKRAIWNIAKNYKKSILMLLVTSVIMTLILSSLAIQRAATKATDDAKSSTSSKVTLTNDMNKLFSEGGTEDVTLIDDTLVEKLKKSKYVKDLDYTIDAYVSTDYKTVESQNNGGMGESTIIGGPDDDQDFNLPTNFVYSLEDIKKNTDFSSGKLTLKEGVLPKESGVDNPVIVSEEFLKLNNLTIGQEIDVKGGPSSTTPMKLTITGTFSVATGEGQSDMDKFFDLVLNDNFYTDIDTAAKIATTNPDGTREIATYQTVSITLTSGKDLDAFINEYESYDMDQSFIKMSSDKAAVDTMLNSINNVGEISNMVVLISAIASVVILGLIIMLSLRERKYELGILLSLGEKKIGLLVQTILESLIIMAFAIILGIGSSVIASNKMQEYIEDAATVQSDEQENNTTNTGNDSVIIMGAGDTKTTPSQIEIPEITIDVLNYNTVIFGLCLGLGIAVSATIMPTALALKKDPKTLLLRRA
ncbi:MAG: ABC transporter permease [Coprobacillaceae bacterium]